MGKIKLGIPRKMYSDILVPYQWDTATTGVQ